MTPELYSVAIFVNDIERAVRFYAEDLELPLVQEGSFGAEFYEGTTRLSVHPAVHPDSKALVGRHTGLTLRVDDLLSYCTRLHERQVRFLNEPAMLSWGMMAMIADPDGNVLALWEPPPKHE